MTFLTLVTFSTCVPQNHQPPPPLPLPQHLRDKGLAATSCARQQHDRRVRSQLHCQALAVRQHVGHAQCLVHS
eukprot:1159774-Pelagomonas_calceolata.AAC.7